MKTLKDHIKEKMYSHLRETREAYPYARYDLSGSLEGRIAEQNSRSHYLMRTITDPAKSSLSRGPYGPTVHDPDHSPHGEHHDLGLAHASYLLSRAADSHRRGGDHAQAEKLLQMATSIHTGPLRHLSMLYDGEHDHYARNGIYPPNGRIDDLKATHGNDWRDPRNDDTSFFARP